VTTLAMFTDQGWGRAIPFVISVYARNATRTPLTVTISVRFCAAAEENEPVWSTPARSRASPVWSIPYCPWSSEWLEAVSQIRHPACLIARAS
jgi:hypothetical protein